MRRMIVGWLMVGLAVAKIAMAGGGGDRIPLNQNAAVREGMVYLSDLLPAEPSEKLREAASHIKICLAPEVASSRLMDYQGLAARLQAYPAIARQLSLPPEVIITNPGWPLDREQVWQAIRTYLLRRGVNLEMIPASASLKGLAGTSTVVENPRIKVHHADLDLLRNAIQFSLRCDPYNGCNPFLIIMDASPQLLQTLRGLTERNPVAVSHNPPNARSASVPAIRAGQSATLVMEGDGIRLAVGVICLASGSLGEQIRVRDPETRRVFDAIIRSPGKLYASF
jgi:hypothetical protein